MSAAFDKLVAYAHRLELEPVGACDYEAGLVGELLLVLCPVTGAAKVNNTLHETVRSSLMECVFAISDKEWYSVRSYAVMSLVEEASMERKMHITPNKVYQDKIAWFRSMDTVRVF